MLEQEPKVSYHEKLLDPRWQEKRRRILRANGDLCYRCKSPCDHLEVHHTYYRYGTDPWDYPDTSLVCLCDICHDLETANRRKATDNLISSLIGRFGLLSDDIDTIGSALCFCESAINRKEIIDIFIGMARRFYDQNIQNMIESMRA